MIQRQWERYRLSIQAQEGQKICCWPPLWSPCRGHSQKFQSQAVEVQGSWWAPLEAEGIIEWEWVLGRAWGQTKIGMRVVKEGGVNQMSWLDQRQKVLRHQSSDKIMVHFWNISIISRWKEAVWKLQCRIWKNTSDLHLHWFFYCLQPPCYCHDNIYLYQVWRHGESQLEFKGPFLFTIKPLISPSLSLGSYKKDNNNTLNVVRIGWNKVGKDIS